MEPVPRSLSLSLSLLMDRRRGEEAVRRMKNDDDDDVDREARGCARAAR